MPFATTVVGPLPVEPRATRIVARPAGGEQRVDVVVSTAGAFGSLGRARRRCPREPDHRGDVRVLAADASALELPADRAQRIDEWGWGA